MTDFEGYTHAQLYAMIASIDPAKVESLGTQLTKAADTIREIGKKLKHHQVKGWEGEAATAFQEWVNQAGSATLELAKYSTNGGKYMTEAATIMREVKPTADGGGNMPPYNAAAEAQLKENLATSRKYHNDPDAVQLGQEAWSKLSGDHARAVDAMNKLAGAYEQSTTQMNNAKIPTFPPPPQVLVPKVYDGGGEIARPGGSVSSGASAGSPHSASGHGGAPSSEPSWTTGNQPRYDNALPPVPTSLVPGREVNLGIDSVSTLSPTAAPPVVAPPSVPVPPGPGGPPPGPFVPPLGMPPMATVTRPGPVGPGIGPYPALGGPGAPGGKVVGTPGLPPRDSGIVGGRTVSTTGPSTGVPRGTVIGEGPHQTARPMGGGVMGPGVGGGYHGGGQGGLPAGRRLASEPGGVIGGRQNGVVGQPFTQGGSGLVRSGAGTVGPMGTHAQTAGPRREGQQGERPDYLAEDEETWQGNRRVVPPVID
ncbi:WXG100 family type VII secretion target [Streptomyces sp. NPDC090112]|uniref:WXG100 family type VII secretion target n=1 Tax=Streptomyces sp. NPDC090112 TaxID=3365949 RepID=UPI00382FD83A